MKKYECAQEMILDLVNRYGCEVKIRPAVPCSRNAIEIAISRDDIRSATKIEMCPPPSETHVCSLIYRTAMELFKYPLDRIIEKILEGEDGK